ASCMRSTASSITARNRPSLLPKWTYTIRGLTPACSTMLATRAPARPRAANSSAPASRIRCRVRVESRAGAEEGDMVSFLLRCGGEHVRGVRSVEVLACGEAAVADVERIDE